MQPSTTCPSPHCLTLHGGVCWTPPASQPHSESPCCQAATRLLPSLRLACTLQMLRRGGYRAGQEKGVAYSAPWSHGRTQAGCSKHRLHGAGDQPSPPLPLPAFPQDLCHASNPGLHQCSAALRCVALSLVLPCHCAASVYVANLAGRLACCCSSGFSLPGLRPSDCPCRPSRP